MKTVRDIYDVLGINRIRFAFATGNRLKFRRGSRGKHLVFTVRIH